MVINNLGTNLSALDAASKKLSESAHNVANSNTDGYKKSYTLIEEAPDGKGVQARTQRDQVTLSSQGQEKDKSNVDYAEETVASMTSTHLYKANLEAIKVEDEMGQTAIDLLA